MPAVPKTATFPAIRGALKFYQIASIITGVMLLLLVAEMVVKYGFGYELYAGGSGGTLWFAPTETIAGTDATGGGVNLSELILIAHGWFYVVYLFACFRIWSLMRWRFWLFLLLASGGIVPALSFILEVRVARTVREHLAHVEAGNPDQTTSARPRSTQDLAGPNVEQGR